MNRSIEVRLSKLESRMPSERPPRRCHIVPGRTQEEEEAEIAKLIAEGASPDDTFWVITPFYRMPDPSSHMHEHCRWDEAAGRWEPEDGRTDIP
jgi:hypothetical protein